METIASAVLSERRSKKPLVLFFTFSFLPPDFPGLFFCYCHYTIIFPFGSFCPFFNNRVISWMEPLFSHCKGVSECEQSVNNSFFTIFSGHTPAYLENFSGILFPAAMQNMEWKKRLALTFTTIQIYYIK